MLYKDGIAAGTARMFTEDGGKTYQIGRVAVLPQYRKYRLGSEIMNAALKKAAELGGKKSGSFGSMQSKSTFMNRSDFPQAEMFITTNIAGMCIWRNFL
ncbi:MAG: GNAT family N-acetyltransferase [Anaerotruncus sp.]|nr:MAG: GNAT family N-acetyltransferase [Anaerotruncus sp.]